MKNLKPFIFSWKGSSSDSSCYESFEFCRVIMPDGSFHPFNTEGEFYRSFGNKGYGIEGFEQDNRVNYPSLIDVCYNILDISPDMREIFGGEVPNHLIELVHKTGIPMTSSLPCYGGSDTQRLGQPNHNSPAL